MDDDEMVQKSVAMMLKMVGYEVESAYDGSAALQLYQARLENNKPFDVVIMDLTIPGGMVGQEAIGKLQQIDPQARALVSSGYSNDPIMAEYAQYGFAGKIEKPVILEELATAVKEVLQRRF
jgi:two-component system cell cycle sensor histidine kinase/response regulator CckA